MWGTPSTIWSSLFPILATSSSFFYVTAEVVHIRQEKSHALGSPKMDAT